MSKQGKGSDKLKGTGCYSVLKQGLDLESPVCGFKYYINFFIMSKFLHSIVISGIDSIFVLFTWSEVILEPTTLPGPTGAFLWVPAPAWRHI